MNSGPGSAGQEHWLTFFKSFCFLFVTTGPAAFLVYFGVVWLQDDPFHAPVSVFNGYFGYELWEISQHPFAFLLSISFLLSLTGSLWLVLVAPRLRRLHTLQALAVPWIAMLLTSPVWGLLWSLFRWHPAGFSAPDVMMMFYRHDIGVGLSLGWLSALISFPINFLSLGTVWLLLMVCRKLILHSPDR